MLEKIIEILKKEGWGVVTADILTVIEEREGVSGNICAIPFMLLDTRISPYNQVCNLMLLLPAGYEAYHTKNAIFIREVKKYPQTIMVEINGDVVSRAADFADIHDCPLATAIKDQGFFNVSTGTLTAYINYKAFLVTPSWECKDNNTFKREVIKNFQHSVQLTLTEI